MRASRQHLGCSVQILPLSRIRDAHHHLNSNSEIGEIVVIP
jgi:hypothetical protein